MSGIITWKIYGYFFQRGGILTGGFESVLGKRKLESSDWSFQSRTPRRHSSMKTFNMPIMIPFTKKMLILFHMIVQYTLAVLELI